MKMYYGDKEVNYVFQGNSEFPLEQSTFWCINADDKGFKNVAERRLKFDTDKNSISGVKEEERCPETLYIPRKIYNNIGEFVNINSIEMSAFSDREDLKKLVLNTDTIHQNAFGGCTNLETLELCDGISIIEDEAFSNCIGLSSITIPASVTNIGTNPFRGCKLSSIWVNPDNNNYTDFGSNAIFEISDDTGSPYKLITGCEETQLDQCVYEDYWLTEIGDYAFLGCQNLQFDSLPESVTTIGNHAFDGIISLGEFHLGNLSQLTEIKEGTFAGCSSLGNITLPDNITKFGAESFKGCTNLQRFDIPTSTTELGKDMFAGCENLQEIVDLLHLIDDNNYRYYGIYDYNIVKHPSEINLFAYDEDDNPISSIDEDGNEVLIKGIV